MNTDVVALLKSFMKATDGAPISTDARPSFEGLIGVHRCPIGGKTGISANQDVCVPVARASCP
jgi:hypothetical protein